MLRAGVSLLLRGVVRQAGRLPPVRHGLHTLSVRARGAGVAFLRVRRLVPEGGEGAAHPDRARGSAITPKELERALLLAKKRLRFVHIGEALSALARGERLTESLAVLTFDESFASTTQLALPVLQALSVPATVFVTTGPLFAQHETLWDSQVHAVVKTLSPQPLTLSFVDRPLLTNTVKARERAVHRLLLSLASLDEVELHRRLAELFALAGGTPKVPPLDRMVSADELTDLAKEPLIAIGAHGHAHLSLAKATEDALLHELAAPRERLLQIAGSSFADVVSYPFGRPPYVNDHVVRAAQKAGYRAGFTALPGVARPGDHAFSLPRLAIDKRAGQHAFALADPMNAIDELVLAATGDLQRVEEAPEG